MSHVLLFVYYHHEGISDPQSFPISRARWDQDGLTVDCNHHSWSFTHRTPTHAQHAHEVEQIEFSVSSGRSGCEQLAQAPGGHMTSPQHFIGYLFPKAFFRATISQHLPLLPLPANVRPTSLPAPPLRCIYLQLCCLMSHVVLVLQPLGHCCCC